MGKVTLKPTSDFLDVFDVCRMGLGSGNNFPDGLSGLDVELIDSGSGQRHVWFRSETTGEPVGLYVGPWGNTAGTGYIAAGNTDNRTTGRNLLVRGGNVRIGDATVSHAGHLVLSGGSADAGATPSAPGDDGKVIVREAVGGSGSQTVLQEWQLDDETVLGTFEKTGLYLFQNGVDATSAVTQKPSFPLTLKGSFWDGVAEQKHAGVLEVVPSTTVEEQGELWMHWNGTYQEGSTRISSAWGSTSVDNGAYLALYGASHASKPGEIELYSGNVAGAVIKLYAQGHTARFRSGRANFADEVYIGDVDTDGTSKLTVYTNSSSGDIVQAEFINADTGIGGDTQCRWTSDLSSYVWGIDGGDSDSFKLLTGAPGIRVNNGTLLARHTKTGGHEFYGVSGSTSGLYLRNPTNTAWNYQFLSYSDGTYYARIGELESRPALSVRRGGSGDDVRIHVIDSTVATFSDVVGSVFNPPKTTVEGMIIRGLGSQTADLFQCQDSGSALKFVVTKDGVLKVLADQTSDTAPNDDTTLKKLTLQKLAAPPTNAAYVAFLNNPGTDKFYLVIEEG